MQNKAMSAKEAVEKFVHDGDKLALGNFVVGVPYALVMEIIRQKKTGLTIYSQTGVFDLELLIAGGCASRVITGFCIRSGGQAGGSMIERYQTSGKIEVEDYSNFTYCAMLMAGAHGFPFMPVLPGIMTTDVFKVRDFMGDKKFGVVKCPFTGKETPVVPAANPDVCIMHVQRADKFGNAQFWGAMGSSAWSALASSRVIVSCEEIVDHEVIKSSPHNTIVPGFRVDAVIEEPHGSHPMELSGYWNLDDWFWAMMDMSNQTEDGFRTWMDEWVYKPKSRAEYIEHYIERFGKDALDRLKAKPYYSAPANYGSAFTSMWKDDGVDRMFGFTRERLEKMMEERGLLIDVNESD